MQGVVREIQQVLGNFDDYERVAELTWVFASNWLTPEEALTPTTVRQVVETAREAGYKKLGTYGVHPILSAMVLTELCDHRFNLTAGEHNPHNTVHSAPSHYRWRLCCYWSGPVSGRT